MRILELYTWMTGEHLVTLTVEDSAGNEATGTIEFEVSPSIQQMMLDFYLDTLKQLLRIKFFFCVSPFYYFFMR